MISKCLFPVAGYGTRFLPATKAMPKEMLPILNTPLIQYGVDDAYDAGMREMAFVTGRTKRAIADHFDKTYELEHQISGTSKEKQLDDIRKLIYECSFSYVRQMEMKGLGDAILTGKTLIGNLPFGVILADDLCVGDPVSVMSQLFEIFKEHQCSIVAVEEVPSQDIGSYGVIAGDAIAEGLYRVNDMVEKPAPGTEPSNLAIIGRYILTPDIFHILEETAPGKNGEVQLTDALKTQAAQGAVLAYKFKGRRFDCGSVDGFVEATNYFYQQSKS